MIDLTITPHELGRLLVGVSGNGLTAKQVDGLSRLIVEEGRNSEDRAGLALALVDAGEYLQTACDVEGGGDDELVVSLREWAGPMLGNPWPEFLLECALPDGYIAADGLAFAEVCRTLGEVLYVPEDEIA